MSMKIRRMTQEAFDQAVENFVYGTGQRSRPFAPLTLEMAKQVLVDGRQAVEVAKENGKHPPALFRAVEKITNSWKPSDDSLVKAELLLPGSLVDELTKLSAVLSSKMEHPEAPDVLKRILMDVSFARRRLEE